MDYLEKFSALDKECQSNFESSDESAETENDKEYQRIRFDVLALLEEAMIKLYENRCLRMKLGGQGRARVCLHFEASHVNKQVIAALISSLRSSSNLG